MTDDNSKPNPKPQEIPIEPTLPTKPMTEGVNKEKIEVGKKPIVTHEIIGQQQKPKEEI